MTNKTGFKETEIGLIPEDWGLRKFSDLIEIIGGGTPKTSIPEYWNGGIPWLSVVDFNNNFRTVEFTEKTISKLGLENSSTKLLKKGDIIISARGTVGAIAQLGQDMAFNQSCYGLKAKKELINNDFLYYLLKFSLNILKQTTHGSTFDTITTNTFDLLNVPFPPIIEQKRVAEILSSLDNKIELNQKMNQTLEKIGQAIFKHWFIDFEFPDEEGKPYKSSGGEMVDSELGEIPKGWEVKDLKDYVKFERGIEPGSKNYFKYQQESMIPFLRVGDLSGKRVSNIFIEEESSKGKICKEEDILLSLDGTVGIVAVGYRGSYSTGIRKIVITDKSIINKSFVWCFLKTGYIQDLIKEHSASKTTIAHAGKAIDFMRMILSDKKTMTNFDNLVSPLFAQIISNIKECQNLSKIRDSLLPKLMSGKIRLNKPINSNHELSKELEA
ncbi:MAG: restriction endonuclease subunit S [Methanobacterium sp.]|jgi:type I restriction enzyme S subunit